MKCPYCNKEMNSGFIQCRDGIYWTPKKQWTPVFSSMADGAVPIGEDDRLMPNSKAIAYNCLQCKTIVIPYGKNEAK